MALFFTFLVSRKIKRISFSYIHTYSTQPLLDVLVLFIRFVQEAASPAVLLHNCAHSQVLYSLAPTPHNFTIAHTKYNAQIIKSSD